MDSKKKGKVKKTNRYKSELLPPKKKLMFYKFSDRLRMDGKDTYALN